MGKFQPVHCRLCGEVIDRNIEKENVDWIMRSKNWYYHKTCYEDWIRKKDDIHTNDFDEEVWKDAAYRYLRNDLRIEVKYEKFNGQWNNLLKSGKTGKGIYFSLKYFYEIQKGDGEKAQGGIGIIRYIYNEAAEYWANRERREAGICARIEAQIRESYNQRRKKVLYKEDSKKKPSSVNLNLISEMDDDE